MMEGKKFDRIAVIVTALMLAVTVFVMNGSSWGLTANERKMGYENRLFDNTKVHTVDIVMNDWDELIDNAASEQYYAANVVIDGEAYKNVGIRAKGNTSLSTVSSMGSERYSLKIEFDHYDKTKSYYGLDKLCLNNLIQDSTMMKDYLTYTMMNEFGVDSSLCSFVFITVNGEDWGLYLAVEGVEEAFLERNYGGDYGKLYKPDSLSFGGGGDFKKDDKKVTSSDRKGFPDNFEMPDFGGNFPDIENFDFENFDFESFDPSQIFGDSGDGKGGFGGFSMGSSDVKLQYSDDDYDSYSNIWNNAKTDILDEDKSRLIASLKKLSENEDIESVVDVEQVIRYFVVHNFVCNGDSYTGSMIHNYYLYEKDGRLAMLPWDYNLAFGTFQGGRGESTVNTPIDSPVENGSGEDRPMWYWIVANEEYTQMYHEYFEEFLNTVDVDGIIDNAYNLIKEYVKKDPTAFYDYDEFEKGVETLKSFCSLRSESISMQLENGETTENMNYADASDITLSDMGSMGGTFGGRNGKEGEINGETKAPQFPRENGEADTENSDFDGKDIEKNDENERMEGLKGERKEKSDKTFPDGDFPDINGESKNGDKAAWMWIGISAAVLAVGLIIAKRFKM